MTAASAPTPTPAAVAARRWFPAIALLLLVGLAFRLALAFWVYPRSGLQADIGLFAHWAQKLAGDGPGAIYQGAPDLNYPPGYLWLLWAWGEIGTVLARDLGQHGPDIVTTGIKLPAILVDILVGWVLYRAVQRWHGSERWGLTVAAVWLFNPATWYDSTLWGQVDTIGVFVGGLALIWLIDRKPELATAAATLAILVKPQFAIFLGIVGVVLLRRHLHRPTAGVTWRTDRTGPIRLLTSAIAAGVVTIVVTFPFDLGSRTNSFAGVPVLHLLAGLLSVMASTAGQYANLTVNAFNPWALLGPDPLIGAHGLGRWMPDSIHVLGIPAFELGAGLFLLVTFGAVLLLWRRPDRDGILVAAVILATAFFVVPTRVHERYLFAAVGLGTLLLPRGRGWWAWLVLASAILLVNMHAILLLPQPWTGTAALKMLPFGDLAGSPTVATLAALGCIPMLLWPLIDGLRLWRQRQPRPASGEVVGAP